MVRDAVSPAAPSSRPTPAGWSTCPRTQPHKAPNYCIQGTARELLIDALVRWSQTRWGEVRAACRCTTSSW
jgi:hypothetical protein